MATGTQPRKRKRFYFLNNNWLEICIVGGLVILFLNLLSWPIVIANESLDGSWQAILTYSLENGLRFGEEVVFTYGPLGGYSSFSYSGYNHAGKYGFELLVRISMVVFLFRFLTHLRPYLKVGCVFLFILILQFLPDVYETYYFFGMLAWAAAVLLEERKKPNPPWVFLLLGLLFIVVASLVKFTLLLAGLFCLGLVVVHLLLQKRFLEGLCLGLAYPGLFLTFWSLLGQRAGDIPGFLHSSSQVAKGYAMSMQLATDPRAVKLFLFFLISPAALVAVVWRDQLCQTKKIPWLKRPWPILLLLYTGFLFMTWKQGVVRSDAHTWQFFCYVPLASWFLFPLVKKQSHQLLFTSLLIVQILLMVAALDSFYPGILAKTPDRFWSHTRDGLTGLLKPNELLDGMKQRLESEKARLFKEYPLLAQVGNRSVDFVGNRQGLIINAGLDYVPRPIFQNYVANNAYLQDLNGRHWLNGETPEAVIQGWDVIDGVSPAHADSRTILHLLSHYRMETQGGGLVLLGRRERPATLNRLDQSEISFSPSEAVVLPLPPSPFLLGKLDMQLNLLGRLRAFLYKPPVVFLDLELETGGKATHRVNPVTVERDFLLSPIANDAAELWRYREGATAPRVVGVTIRTAPGGALFYKKRAILAITSVEWMDSSTTAP